MYAYTTGTLQDTITYTYGNTAWKDQLTNYDGTAISYDASGNPTNWIGNLNTLTWNGRQLSSISMPNNQRIDFRYNSDGIRTYKYFIDNTERYYYQHDYMLEGSTIVGEKVNYFSYYNWSMIANGTTTLIGVTITKMVNMFRNKVWNEAIDFISCFFSAGSMVAGFLDAIDGDFDGECRLW